MHSPWLEFTEDIAAPLALFYAAAAAGNVVAAVRGIRAGGPARLRAIAWILLAGSFAALGAVAWKGSPLGLPEAVKTVVNAATGPVTVFFGLLGLLILLHVARGFFARPAVAWCLANAGLMMLGLSMADANFARIVLTPDSVPIVGMVLLLGFFVWLATAKGVENDRRLKQGLPPVEQEHAERTLVWPDLVYIELIAMVLLSAGLIAWSLLVRAPLEPPANPVVTPNPSKAPWYFVGLQEMLVYFDPTIAGVVVPALIILGLALIPFLDFKPAGAGYYSVAQRRPGYLVFLFGYLQLWVMLILVGTFLRGPNWEFFGPFAAREADHAPAAVNVKLSEFFWTRWLGRDPPTPQADAGAAARFGTVVWREIAGVVALGVYFVGMPLVLRRTLLRRTAEEIGPLRYVLMTFLLLMMLALPLKMLLRWTCHLSYVVSMPEYFFSF